jgi:peptidoglycan hydrolase CwlO-like protein
LRCWVITGGILLALAAGSWALGKVTDWRIGLPAAIKEDQGVRQELQDTKEQLATSQGAIREMSKQIGTLTVEANGHKAKALAAAARAQTAAGEVARLRGLVSDLEAARKATPVPRSAEEAAAALRALGYPAEARP